MALRHAWPRPKRCASAASAATSSRRSRSRSRTPTRRRSITRATGTATACCSTRCVDCRRRASAMASTGRRCPASRKVRSVPQFADAKAGQPYHGYLYKILTAQGKDAPGGARSYLKNGRMTEGYALIAWPAKYDDTGVMTFIVNQDGVVYQKNLGRRHRRRGPRDQRIQPGRDLEQGGADEMTSGRGLRSAACSSMLALVTALANAQIALAAKDAAASAAGVAETDRLASSRSRTSPGRRLRQDARAADHPRLCAIQPVAVFVDKGRERGIGAELVRDFERWVNEKSQAARQAAADDLHRRGDARQAHPRSSRRARGHRDRQPDRHRRAPESRSTSSHRTRRSSMSRSLSRAPRRRRSRTIDDLSGKTVHVRKASSYYDSLTTLNERFRKSGKPPVNLVLVPDALEDEDMLEMTERRPAAGDGGRRLEGKDVGAGAAEAQGPRGHRAARADAGGVGPSARTARSSRPPSTISTTAGRRRRA